MNRNPKVIIQKVLELIGYEDDKEAFADEFLKNVYLQSVRDLLLSLPRESQAVKSKISDSKTPEEIDRVVKENFPSEEIEETLKKKTQDAMTEWIKTMSPTLSAQQKQNLQEYFATFRSETAV